MPAIKRRKRPVEIYTIEWTGDNEQEIRDFTGAENFHVLTRSERETCGEPHATARVYDHIQSTWVLLRTGHHVARGVKGEYYPIADDALDDTCYPPNATPEARPSRSMSAPGPRVTLTSRTHRVDMRQVGWIGQTGSFYALDENPLGSGQEKGGVSPLYFPAHTDRLDDVGASHHLNAINDAVLALTSDKEAVPTRLIDQLIDTLSTLKAQRTNVRPPEETWLIQQYDDIAEEWSPGSRYSGFPTEAAAVSHADLVTGNARLNRRECPRRRVVHERTTWSLVKEIKAETA